MFVIGVTKYSIGGAPLFFTLFRFHTRKFTLPRPVTYKYLKVHELKIHKYYFGFMLFALAFAYFPNMRRKALATSLFFLLCSFYSYIMFFLHKHYRIFTDDNGFRVSSYFKELEFAWSEVIAVKKSRFGSYKVETKKGTISINPKGLMPIELCTGKKADEGYNSEGFFISEMTQKAKQVRILGELKSKS